MKATTAYPYLVQTHSHPHADTPTRVTERAPAPDGEQLNTNSERPTPRPLLRVSPPSLPFPSHASTSLTASSLPVAASSSFASLDASAPIHSPPDQGSTLSLVGVTSPAEKQPSGTASSSFASPDTIGDESGVSTSRSNQPLALQPLIAQPRKTRRSGRRISQ